MTDNNKGQDTPKFPDGYEPQDLYACKPIKRYLLEKFGLTRYMSDKGKTTILIDYDAEKDMGKMVILHPVFPEAILTDLEDN